MTEKTGNAAETAPSDRARDTLLDAMLAIAAARGWTPAALDAAGVSVGLSKGEILLACPNGVADLLEAFARRAAAAAENALGSAELKSMKIRERVTFGVKAWLDALEAHKAAVKRAAASPANLLTGPKGLWLAADAIWAGLGDKSTDYNWYTKRIILSGVLGSTLLAWLGEDNQAEVDAFLARRIENVMAFEKAKGRVRDFVSTLPDPLDLLGRKA